MGALLDSLLGGLGYVGESLDKPGATVRGLLGGQGAGALANLIPFSDTLGFTDPSQRMSGRGLLEHYGALQPKGEDDGFGFGDLLGMGVDVATDPLQWAGAMGLGKLSRVNRLAEETNGIRAKNLVRNKQIQELLNAGAMPEEVAGLTKVRNEAGPVPTYHGTPQVFDKYDMAKMNPEGLYGPAIYTTANPDLASRYVEKGAVDNVRYVAKPGAQEAVEAGLRRLQPKVDATSSLYDMLDNANGHGFGDLEMRQYDTLHRLHVHHAHMSQLASDLAQGATEAVSVPKGYGHLFSEEGSLAPRNVRKQFLDIRNPFDADAHLSHAEMRDIGSKLHDSPDHFRPSPRGASAESLYRDLAESSDNILEKFPELARHFDDGLSSSKALANELLQKLGYDGLTHLGGGRAGGGGLMHQVYLAFNPSQVYHPMVAPALREVPALARQRSLSPLLAAMAGEGVLAHGGF